MAETQKTVRIFLAAPARDTAALCAVIQAEVERICSSRLAQRVIQVELVHWDNPAKRIPMSWLRPPQEAVNHFTGGPSSCDLVIGVFRHVFGSELDANRFGTRPDGQRWACTEWELHCAAQAAKEGLVKDVLIFQDMTPLPRRGKTPAECKANETELQRVTDFIAQAREDGCANRGVHEFEGDQELAEDFPGLLDAWLNDYLARIDVPSTPERSPAALPMLDLSAYRQRRSKHWRTSAAGQLDRRFVNLTLMIDHGLTHDGPRHEDAGRYDRLDQLLAERSDVGAWVLVGDPGGGKSTILQHHELTTAAAALSDEVGALPEVCVWQRLSTYSHDSPPPAEWLAQHWPEDLPTLAALRGVARVRFLLDGLNEIKAPDRTRQLEAVDRWTEWASRLADHADHLLAPIFSVRTLDQSPLSTGDFEVRQIVVGRWSRDQIQAYCVHMLGEGNALWPAIDDDPHLLELSALPFNLRAQCELFDELGEVVRDRARLMGGLFWLRLRKQARTAPLKVPGLIGEDDVLLLSGDRWKSMLAALPEAGCLVPWLDDRAQVLHRLGRQVSVSRRDLLKALPPHEVACAPADWLKAVCSLQLIDEGQGDATALRRFSHQLWQEFFAARGLRDLADGAPERLPDLRPPALAPLDEVLAKLGVQEPLPGPDPSHWEEPVKLAVQLVRDPLAWVRALEAVNLALAGRAAVACQQKAEALHGSAVFDGLRQALLKRSRDAAVDVRLRIEAGLVLGDLGDPRYERRTGPHGDFLWPKSEHWVRIPGGRYTIGNNDGPSFEGPETPVMLEAFEMAFAPVTNAEFRCFVEAKGYEQLEWWDDPLARQWLKEGLRNEREIQRLQAMVDEAKPDIDAYMSRYNWTNAYKDRWREFAKQPQDKITAQLEEWYGANDKGYTEPQEWQNPAFNAAAQPVVGICFFEVMAYTKWLTAQAGLPPGSLRPPLEAEWEVAARGGSARRRWPWVGPDPEPGRINDGAARLQRTSPVGVFPQSDTPDGLVDMAGNVWEWTISEYIEEPNRHDAKALVTPVPAGPARRVVRGGAWDDSAGDCRASYRDWPAPADRRYDLGLRLVRRLGPHSEPGSQDHRASDATRDGPTAGHARRPDHRASDATPSR